MKKAIAFLLALIMLAASLPALGEEAAEQEEAWEAEWDDADGEEFPPPAYDYDSLRVGNPTRMKGDFYTDMWGNATSDLDVRALIHGYDLIRWDGENGLFTTDPTVVNGIIVTGDGEGNRTYSLSLYSDLYYCDGSEITAWDYAFTLLLSIDPMLEQLGAKPLRKDHILGYAEYISGESPALAGVHVVNDRRLDITLRREYLPFFYELGLLSCQPSPIGVIAPGCEVKDDGQGVYIAGDFTAELLASTLLDPETGYRTHPALTCGPYVLTAFDGDTAQFDINPYYKGNAAGQLPLIPHIEYTLADNETMMDALGAGEFGLLNKVTKADAILAGTQLIGTGYFAPANYPRSGLTFISFNCEKAAVQSQSVRQAIACCVDKDQLVADYVGNFGLRVEGFYGMGQWMYQLLTGAMAYPEPEEGQDPAELAAAYDALVAQWDQTLEEIRSFYALDPNHAALLLELDGWTLNRQGQPFVPGVDDVRCKQLEGGLTALELTLAYPEGNGMAHSLEQRLIPALAEAGIGLTLVPCEMTALLDMFYGRADRDADMLYLGTDFDVVFDPSTHFIPREDGALTWNYTGAADEELYRLAVELRKTEPGDLKTYCQRWIAFQQRFAELQPMIPIYSNVYFDFFTRSLHSYAISENVTWTQAIVGAYMSDMEDEEEEEADEDADDLGEDEAFFDD